jgi:sugar lactone lactonase YvrE
MGIAMEPEPELLHAIPMPHLPLHAIVADAGNGSIRKISESGQVETIAVLAPLGSSPAGPDRIFEAASAPAFISPAGVALDAAGNIYVTEPGQSRVRAILRNGEVVSVTQQLTFSSPWGIAVGLGGKILVVDSRESLRQISYGEPRIAGINPERISNKGGERVTVKGGNFAPDTILVVGNQLVSKFEQFDTQTIIFTTPPLPSGRSTLTVQNRGGLAQKQIFVDAVPLSQLLPGQITTVAGGATFAGDGGAAAMAFLAFPAAAAVDATGNLFIADRHNHRIRKISAGSAIVTTVAGNGQPSYSGDGGPATAAGLKEPEGVALDPAGGLVIADGGNYRIRRVDPNTGIISTIAGGGHPPDDLGDGGPATEAALSVIGGVAVDTRGNLYIADTGNHRIRKVDSGTRTIATMAGNGTAGFSGDGGPATRASVHYPDRIAVDAAGNLFLADTGNRRIRRVDAVTGIVTTVAGTGAAEFSGDHGPATAAGLDPGGVAFDAQGNLFIADRGNERIRRVDVKTQIITTVAGTGQTGSSGDGGPALAATLRFVHGITIDAAGNLYIADSGNQRLRIVDAMTQTIDRLAGGELTGYWGDGGLATDGALKAPLAIAVDGRGNLCIADSDNNRVRKVDAAGHITAFAGTGGETFSGDGGPATAAALLRPAAIAFDADGNLYIAASGNSRILKVETSTGILRTVAGNGDEGYYGDNGPAINAALNLPNGIAVDAHGDLFIADTFNHRIRKVNAKTGTITTVAGDGRGGYSGDNGPGTMAALNEPGAVAVDEAGFVYVADAANFRIRRLDASGIITTVAGMGVEGFSGDGGIATGAALAYLTGVAVDRSGNLFIADGNNRIRRVAAGTGIIRTVAGTGEGDFSGDNGPAVSATFGFPHGLALDASGNLFLADTYNCRIRAIRGPIR